MYNPMSVQLSSSDVSSSFIQSTTITSHRVSWDNIMTAKETNTEFLRDRNLTTTYHDPYGYYNSPINGKGNSHHVLRIGHDLPSMSAALVPDSRYRAYLSGKATVNKSKSGFDKITIAKLVGFFSLVGFIFLTFVGILIDAQPMFLQGILTKNDEYSSSGKKRKIFYAITIKDRLEPAKNAYRGGLLYLLTSVACLAYAHNMHHFLFKKGWQQYRDVDDVDDATVAGFCPGGKTILGADKEYLPTSGAVRRPAYWDQNGLILRTWHSASVKFQRLVIYLESIWQARRRNRRRFAGAKDV